MSNILNTIIADAVKRLAAAGIDNPRLDVRLLVGHALGLDRAQLLSQSERVPTADETRRIEDLMARRSAGESVARIVGEREFWSLPFGLNEATLEPRPDSETLVEVALKALKAKNAPRLLDLGTGSGCLLLALVHELPEASGLGIDIAPRAVEQAAKNAEHLGLAARAAFRTGNWCDGITETFDAIISNPPYIASGDIPALMPEVREHDPLRALDGGLDGLDIYRRLTPQIAQFLRPQGFVIFEVGQGQADAVAALCGSAGFRDVEKFRDLNGIERCVTGRKA